MSGVIEQILGFTTFSALILSVLADIILASTWAKIYFTWGLVLFSQHVSVELPHTEIPSASLLNNKLDSFWMGGFIFKELDTNRYAFRRKFFSFALRSMVHGSLTFDTENHKMTVKGYLDWFMVAFFVMMLAPLVVAPIVWLIDDVIVDPDFVLGAVVAAALLVLVFGILYLMDYFRVARITTVAAELWARKYVPRH